MNEEIYLAILEDRHIDDTVRAFRKPFHALKQITEWQHSYGDRYEWEEQEIEGWEYYCTAGDDCPNMRIERITLC
ncbi:hypothetical protein LCGC14_2216140 [marine sediment metagenome]|uniref:Uncharacterized protein n=1 Tax=marine sediment metagenome TaxID=412755 RepID=A0A0F9DZT8_9ZZZZ